MPHGSEVRVDLPPKMPEIQNLAVYDVLGTRLQIRVNKSGHRTLYLKDFPGSGIYIVVLKAGQYSRVRKVAVVE